MLLNKSSNSVKTFKKNFILPVLEYFLEELGLELELEVVDFLERVEFPVHSLV